MVALKRTMVFAIVVVLIVTLTTTAFITINVFLGEKAQEFYVGITYCGNTTTEAKALIDKVKGYTNLFVLQSGTLQYNESAINEVGDYAVNAGMHYLVYFGTDKPWTMKRWVDSYDGHWGLSFLGIYFGDEPGGKMLDAQRVFTDEKTHSSIVKFAGGNVSTPLDDRTSVNYMPDGTIELTEANLPTLSYTVTTYYVNGTITVATHKMQRNSEVAEMTASEVKDNSTLAYTYEELWNARPLQNYDETAQIFVDGAASLLKSYGSANITCFTSDYALYWFDYLAGYDTVLAQLGWNHTTTQDIGLVRGAANLQGKSWGTIITWKYTEAPYLASGQEIYDQMRLSYECGAKYVVIFNYAEDMNGTYGTLEEEHFQALERFWREVVKNPFVGHGSVNVEAAFVLPKNYGCGLRKPQDTVWGLWQPIGEYQQIWPNLQVTLAKYGEHLDIVYNDSTYALSRYTKVFYWNQTV